MRLLSTLAAFAALALMAQASFANELDHEGGVTNIEQRALAAQLPGTVVVRVKQIDQSVAVLHSTQALPASEMAFDNAQFAPMDTHSSMTGAANRSELDRDSSTNSWYFYFGYNSYRYPTYYYGGYTYWYRPYYTYYYGGYAYYYYGYGYWY